MESSKKQLVEAYENAVQENFTRNSLAVVLFEFIWGMSLPFGMFAVLVPIYMSAIGSPKALIGVVGSLYIITCPFQLVVSHCAKAGRRRKWLVLIYFSALLPWLAYNLACLLFPGFDSSVLQNTVLFVCMFFFASAVTGSSPVYHSMIRDFTPFKKRGVLYGYRIVASALGAFLASWPALKLLGSREEPRNYVLGFIVSIAFMAISLLPLFLVREFKDCRTTSTAREQSSIGEFIVNVRLVYRKARRNPNYLVFIYCATLFVVSIALGSFIVVCAREKMAMTGSGAVVLVMIQTLISALFSVGLGKLGDRIGFRKIGFIQAMLLCVGFAFAALAVIVENMGFLVYPAFMLCASGFHVGNLVLWYFSFELLPKADSSILLSLTNLFVMPAVLLMVPLSGFIIDFTGSFMAVFIFGACFSLFSAMGFLLMVPEPRSGKIYAIRHIRKI